MKVHFSSSNLGRNACFFATTVSDSDSLCRIKNRKFRVSFFCEAVVRDVRVVVPLMPLCRLLTLFSPFFFWSFRWCKLQNGICHSWFSRSISCWRALMEKYIPAPAAATAITRTIAATMTQIKYSSTKLLGHWKFTVDEVALSFLPSFQWTHKQEHLTVESSSSSTTTSHLHQCTTEKMSEKQKLP